MNEHTPPIKCNFRLDAQPERVYEIYNAACTVRSKLGKSNPEIHSYINKLEDYVNGAIIQYYRIQEEHKQSIDAHLDAFRGFTTNYALWDEKLRVLDEKMFPANAIIFLDIHYYLICLDKIHRLYPKLMKQVSSIHEKSANDSEIRTKRKYVDSRFRQAELKLIKDARNFLEHIDENIQKGKPISLNHEKNEHGDWFKCADGEYSVSINPKPITNAYEALIEMLRSLPDIE